MSKRWGEDSLTPNAPEGAGAAALASAVLRRKPRCFPMSKPPAPHTTDAACGLAPLCPIPPLLCVKLPFQGFAGKARSSL